jgi:hypothetical protein
MSSLVRTALLAGALVVPVRLASAVDLDGSPASMVHQHLVAVQEDYTFLRTPSEVQRLVDEGKLVAVAGGADYTLSGVSFPYTRPEVLSFIEHFAASFHDSTGAQLVVTSLTRPETKQPVNAHVLSVHPAGMAVDFRVPAEATNRAFLERYLLGMERSGFIDVTREHRPPHYHVAVFGETYLPDAARLDSIAAVATTRERVRRLAAARALARVDSAAAAGAGGSRLPAELFGLFAVVGMTAPAVRRARRRRTAAPPGG